MKQEEFRTHTFKAKTSKAGYRKIEWALEFARTLWNDALAERIDYHRKTGKILSKIEQDKELTEIRNTMPELGLKDVHCDTFEYLLERLHTAFERLRKGVSKYPRFKGKGRPIRSIDMRKKRFGIFPVGDSGTRWRLHIHGFEPIIFDADPKKLGGDIRKARILMKATGLYVQFQVKETLNIRPASTPVVGLDMGITHQVTTSTGLKLKKSVRNTEESKRHQRKMSRKQKKSNSRKKAKASLARACEREATRMKNLAHEFTTFLIKTHGPWIAMEDLKIKNMMKNHCLARSISDSLWRKIRNMLEYKCRRAGGRLILVDPRNTSKTCNACKEKRDSAPLGMRVFECETCGFVACRDVNAACNVGDRGLDALDEDERKLVLGAGRSLPAGFADVENPGVKAIIDWESMGATDLQGSRNRCPSDFGHSGK